MHRHARLRLEKAHEVVPAEIHPVGEHVHGQLPREVFVYVGERFFYLLVQLFLLALRRGGGNAVYTDQKLHHQRVAHRLRAELVVLKAVLKGR